MENNEIHELLAAYGQLDYHALAGFVERLESTEAGQAIVQKNPDRRVYAILTPTKDEYLQRLEALLKLSDGKDGELLLLDLHTMLPMVKFSWCISLHYHNGAITHQAALDLHARLWGIVPLDAPIAGWSGT